MSNQTSDNNKRIAKNTLMLYTRTFITMCVSLYTGRILMQALGVENYGINNVVGGIVGMSGIITGTMAAATSRYITYAIGEGDINKQKTVFSTSVNVQLIMALLAIIVLEIVGVWFLNTQASIPEGRMIAAAIGMILYFCKHQDPWIFGILFGVLGSFVSIWTRYGKVQFLDKLLNGSMSWSVTHVSSLEPFSR